jgi:putative ABC transport system permease protein
LIVHEQALRTAPTTMDVTAPGGLPLTTVEQIVAVPGVTGAAATLPTRAIVSEAGKPEDYAAVGLLTAGTEKALDLGVRPGALVGEGTQAGTFAASASLVEARGWRVGDNVDVWLADGQRFDLRLAAVYERSRGFADIVLPASLVAQHDPKGLANTVALRTAAADTAQRVGDAWPELTVVSTVEATGPSDAPNQQGAWELMVVVSLGFTAIAVVNTFAIATSARRREYAGLRLAGATTGQIWRMASRESLIAVGSGLLLGCAVTAVVVGVFSTAQDGHFRLIVDGGLYFGMIAAVAALGVLAGSVPARVVLRRRSLPAIAEDL